jgi:hypothetical protein
VCWLHALRQLALKESTSETLFFMDGPFRTDIKVTSDDSIELVLVDFHTPVERMSHVRETSATPAEPMK